MTIKTVLAIPTYETSTGTAINVGTAETVNEAIALIESLGYTVIPYGSGGGNVDEYDAEESQQVYDIDCDGLATISVTVEP